MSDSNSITATVRLVAISFDCADPGELGRFYTSPASTPGSRSATESKIAVWAHETGLPGGHHPA
jgi:hypothetical protein